MESPYESRLIDRLESLFSALEPAPGPNLCGECRICCTAAGLSKQQVTDLELALLARHYGEVKAQSFARYARREKTEEGAYLHEVCPNLGSDGCQAYQHRPFSCRVFGRFRMRETRLPDPCVYQGKEQEFEAADYYRRVPGAVELRMLSREYQLRRPGNPQVSEGSGPLNDPRVGLNMRDPWDRALELALQGKPQEAREQLPPYTSLEGVFAAYVRALVAGELGDHEDAIAAYDRVLDCYPHRSDLRTFCGYHHFQLGRFHEAESHWVKSLAGDPNNPLTYSFLGYLYMQQGQWRQAADFFGAAAELEPEQPLHRQRREQALEKLAHIEKDPPEQVLSAD